MMDKDIKYKICVTSPYPEWWRYNVFLIAASYGSDGERSGFADIRDCVDPAAANKLPVREVILETGPCAYADIYLYIVANTFPGSDRIKDSPPFDAVMTVFADGQQLQRIVYEVNQWGGLTVVAHRADARGRKVR